LKKLYISEYKGDTVHKMRDVTAAGGDAWLTTPVQCRQTVLIGTRRRANTATALHAEL